MTKLKIGDEVNIHGYIDEIRKDVVIIRNDGGYFGTVQSEIKALEQQPSDDTWSIKDVTNALTRHGLLEQEPSEKEKELNRLEAELQRAKMDAQTSYIQSPMPTSMIDKSNFNIEQYKSDVPPVTPTCKVGKWIPVHHIENKITYDSWKCSECQHDFDSEEESTVDFDEYKYCPNCGAEMRGSENE